jgi:hypothetical protein
MDDGVCMSGRVVALASCWYGLLSSAAFAFSVDGSYVTRAFSQQVVLTNSSIQVTATFTNLGTNLLRGFSYLEQIPSTLSVTTLSVSLGGRDLTNFTFESGQDGDVYAGCTPRRWVLETPTNFAEANPLPPQAGVQIVYSLVCSSAGTFALQNFSWAGGTLGAADAVFGYSESSALRMVKFITTTNSPLLSGERSTNGFALWIDGLPGSIYLLTASTNLVNWVPLATNLSPFAFIDTNTAAFPYRFYGAFPFTNPWAGLTIARSPTNAFSLWVNGVAECSYVLEGSTNLLNWVPVLTNISPFNSIEAAAAGVPMRFYRGRLLPFP